MEQIFERLRSFAEIVGEEQRVERECQRNSIDYNVVKRISESTHWKIGKAFDFCLRNKEAIEAWPYQKAL